jgi:hypothetical protein
MQLMRAMFKLSPTLTPDRVGNLTLPQIEMLLDDSDGMIRCDSIDEAKATLKRINQSKGRI